MPSELNGIFRKKARDFKGRIELMKKIPTETAISLFFELCNFNLNNYIKTEKARYPDKSVKDIIIKTIEINKKIKRSQKIMEVRYEKAFFQIINFLEKIEREFGIKYYLVGGILVSIYSETRTTQDIDFVVDIYSVNHNIDTYIELLKKNEFYPLQDWISASEIAKEIQLLQFLDKQQVIKFDNYIIYRKSYSKYKKIGPVGLKRRVRINFGGLECWVASKEDYILSKLVFGGWQDYTDALGCWLRFHEELDKEYLELISKELEIQREYALLISGIDDPDDFFKQLKDER